jgi:hypothetical protein
MPKVGGFTAAALAAAAKAIVKEGFEKLGLQLDL